jgi:hypothetical protein
VARLSHNFQVISQQHEKRHESIKREAGQPASLRRRDLRLITCRSLAASACVSPRRSIVVAILCEFRFGESLLRTCDAISARTFPLPITYGFLVDIYRFSRLRNEIGLCAVLCFAEFPTPGGNSEKCHAKMSLRSFRAEEPPNCSVFLRKIEEEAERIRVSLTSRECLMKIAENWGSEREGFEPSVEFPLHTLSKRAPSTTRTSLRASGSTVYSDSKTASIPIVK